MVIKKCPRKAEVGLIRFNCDYGEGAHPRILARLQETNLVQTPGYGEDEYCREAADIIRSLCEMDALDVHFLMGGTQANLTVLSAALRPWQGVVSTDAGHIAVHETGSIEACGHKVLCIPHENGKLRAEAVAELCRAHYADASFGERIGAIARGSYLTVHAEENGVADITYYGKDGYMPVSALTYVQGEAEDAVVIRQTRFHQQPDRNSAYGLLAAGTAVRLMSVNGTCAMIEYDEHIGFVMRSDIRTASENASQPTAAPTAAPEQGGEIVRETFTATVASENAYVYQSRSTSAQRMRVAQGRVLTVVAYDDTWAQVFNGSFYAFIPRADIKRVETATAQPTVAPTATPAPTDDVVQESFTATVTAQGARVYQSPSTDAVSSSLAYGSTVTVVAYDDTWAQISNGSQLGFTQRSNLTPGIVAVATPTPTPAAGSFEELVESGKYSNEELTFLYLTREAGLNAAAACGVMANIKAESSFRPTAYNSNGGSYGICQWTGGRKTRLQNYCEDNGLDYTTIYGQLCTSPPWTTPRTALTTRATTSAITLKCPPTAPAAR